MSTRRRAAAVLGVLVAGVIGVVATTWNRTSAPAKPRDALVAVLGDDFPFQVRLSGGFAPPREEVQRGRESNVALLSPDARIVLAELEKRAASDTSLEAQADLGIAYLLQGDVDRAIRTLDDVAAQQPTAAVWNDLAAAYLVRAERTPDRDLEYLARGLEAAAQSLRVAPTSEARFNQLIALERLAPVLGQPPDWAVYLSEERDSRWVEAVRRRPAVQATDSRVVASERVAELRATLGRRDPVALREVVAQSPETAADFFNTELIVGWAKAVLSSDSRAASQLRAEASALAEAIRDVTADPMLLEAAGLLEDSATLLARAHLTYLEGVGAYARTVYDEARLRFTEARRAFSSVGSPYALSTDVQLATLDFQERALREADVRLAGVEAKARARSYWAVYGRAVWMHGLVFAKQWRLSDALAAFREAAWRYEQSNQREHAAAVYHQLADTYRTLGEQHQTWEHIGRTLRAVHSVRNPISRYLFYYNATLFAVRQDLLEIAWHLQSAAVREALNTKNDGVIAEALTQRALVSLKRRDAASAQADAAAAANHLARVAETGRQRYLAAELDLVRAELATADASLDARLADAVTFFSRAEPGRVPGLLLGLGRRYRIAGAPEKAVQTLAEGITRLESQQAAMTDEALKISYFDDSWSLFAELLSIHTDQRQPEKAFELAERARARLLASAITRLSETRPPTVAEVRKTLGDGMTFLYYVTLPDRMVIWALRRDVEKNAVVRVAARDVARLVEHYRAALASGTDSGLGAKLYDLLIAPVEDLVAEGETLVIAADGALQQLPFAALPHPITKQFLVERHPLLMTPSAAVFAALQSRTNPGAGNALRSALLVGNPASDGAALPAAQQEAVAIAGFYPDAKVLLGRDATKQRFLSLANRYEVVHFGGHGYANTEYPLLSRLEFAQSDRGEPQSLFAHEIAGIPFPKTRLVVLAACSTAGGGVSRGEGVVSVARPFLAAGVPQIVASQWDVDDAATRELFVTFHRVLSQTRNAVEALRAAQLSLLRSENRALALPRSWAAFVAIGTLVSQSPEEDRK